MTKEEREHLFRVAHTFNEELHRLFPQWARINDGCGEFETAGLNLHLADYDGHPMPPTMFADLVEADFVDWSSTEYWDREFISGARGLAQRPEIAAELKRRGITIPPAP